MQHEDWFARTVVYLYRGAWQEWEPWEADMCVPLSSADLEAKVGFRLVTRCWLSSIQHAVLCGQLSSGEPNLFIHCCMHAPR